MDVGLDKAGRDQPAAEIDGFALGREPRLDRGDLAAGDADVGQFLLGADSARVSRDEIHVPSPVIPGLADTEHPDCDGGRDRRPKAQVVRPVERRMVLRCPIGAAAGSST